MFNVKNSLLKIPSFYPVLRKKTNIDKYVNQVTDDIKNGNLHFDNFHYARKNGRKVVSYRNGFSELVVLHFLSKTLKKIFNLNYSNRNDICFRLFNVLKLIENESVYSDFTIVRFDFKKYFYSLSTSYIYQKYIKYSDLNRPTDNLLRKFVSDVPFLFAGIDIASPFSEIIGRDFDNTLKKYFNDFGILFYERYVDDGIIIFKNFVKDNEINNTLERVLKDVFFDDKICCENKNRTTFNKTKQCIIHSNNKISPQAFNYLGYAFCLNTDGSINYGIEQRKIDKYKKRIFEFIKTNQPLKKKYVKYFVKFNSKRLVYYSKEHHAWIDYGVIANYRELLRNVDVIDANTVSFMKTVYIDTFKSLGFSVPKYLSQKKYNLYNNFVNYRTIILDKRIGCNDKYLEKVFVDLGLSIGTLDYKGKLAMLLRKLGVGYIK